METVLCLYIFASVLFELYVSHVQNAERPYAGAACGSLAVTDGKAIWQSRDRRNVTADNFLPETKPRPAITVSTLPNALLIFSQKFSENSLPILGYALSGHDRFQYSQIDT